MDSMKFRSRSSSHSQEPAKHAEKPEPVVTRRDPVVAAPEVVEEVIVKPKASRKTMAFLSVMFLAMVGAIVYMAFSATSQSKDATISTIDSRKYQAVTLTDGGIYFGKLEVVNSGYVKLSNAYYLKPQAKKTDSATSKTDATQPQDQLLSLEKLSAITYGPDDEMTIPRDKIVHFENLNGNSKVSQLIQQNSK